MSDTLDLGALQKLLERVRGLKTACVGDLMLDRYVYGEEGKRQALYQLLPWSRRRRRPRGGT